MTRNVACFLVALAVVLLSFAGRSEALQARAWQNTEETLPNESFTYPEAPLLAQQGRTKTAIAFTGGGSRSFIASFGYLSALYQLQLIDKLSYISGISGGNWATMAYTYSQHDPADEAEFLGPIVPPEEIEESALKTMSPKCARRLTDADFVAITLKALSQCPTLGDMWCHATQEVYLAPLGIRAGSHWAYTKEQVDDIVSRNPGMSAADFLLPNQPSRPFPIVGATLLGPQEGAPYIYSRANQNYTFFEMTPMYVGNAKNLAMEYNTNKKHSDTIQKRTVGGFLETFAFAQSSNSTDSSSIAPTVGLQPGQATAMLEVPAPKGILDLRFASGASSFAPGAFFDSFKIQKPTSLHFDYFSPADPSNGGQAATEGKKNMYDTLFADGGSLENIPLISLIQRGVKRIMYCANSGNPLQPASKWNIDSPGATDIPDQIDNSIPAFFGVDVTRTHGFQDRSYSLINNQVFATADYAGVVKGLQAAQAAGNGIIYRTTLTTVQNLWWGVTAGVEVDITFMYLGRVQAWESKLSAEMRELVVPKDDAEDMSSIVKKGKFKHFPNYPTVGGDVNSEQANLLADLAGWTVLNNAELFRDIVQ